MAQERTIKVNVEFITHHQHWPYWPFPLTINVSEEEEARIIEKWRYPSRLQDSVDDAYRHMYDDIDRSIYRRIEAAFEDEKSHYGGWQKDKDSISIWWPQEEIDRLGIGMNEEERTEKRRAADKLASEVAHMVPESMKIDGHIDSPTSHDLCHQTTKTDDRKLSKRPIVEKRLCI